MDPPDYSGARVLFRAASQARPDSASGQVNYGLALYASGDEREPSRPTAPRSAWTRPTPRPTAAWAARSSPPTRAPRPPTLLEDASTRFPQDAAIRADLFAAYEAHGPRRPPRSPRDETELARATPATEADMRLADGVALPRPTAWTTPIRAADARDGALARTTRRPSTTSALRSRTRRPVLSAAGQRGDVERRERPPHPRARRRAAAVAAVLRARPHALRAQATTSAGPARRSSASTPRSAASTTRARSRPAPGIPMN